MILSGTGDAYGGHAYCQVANPVAPLLARKMTPNPRSTNNLMMIPASGKHTEDLEEETWTIGRLDGLATCFIKLDCFVNSMWSTSACVQYIWRQVVWQHWVTQGPTDTQPPIDNAAFCMQGVAE